MRLARLASKDWAIVSIRKEHHLEAMPHGCVGYLSNFLEFKPEIVYRYWNAIKAREWSRAAQVVREFDIPFMDYISQLTGGPDAGMHATFELFGTCQRWRRRPYYSLSDREMEELRRFLIGLSVL
jgi:dihydrodipicolinate synthase/N-acetylneuraminate lyase